MKQSVHLLSTVIVLLGLSPATFAAQASLNWDEASATRR